MASVSPETDPFHKPIVAPCKCGKVSFTQRRPGGMAVFKCHCSQCRKACEADPVTKGAYVFEAIDWCCNVSISGKVTSSCTSYRPYGCPCPLWCVDRKRCAECGDFVCAYGYGGVTGLAVVNCSAIQRALPEGHEIKPKHEQFYNSGLKASPPTAPRVCYGDLGSTFGLLYNVLCLGAPCYGSNHCCCIGWGKPDAYTRAEA